MAMLELVESDSACGPVLVHADLMKARVFVRGATSRAKMLDAHLNVLLSACGDRPLWTPCFNYDFCGAGVTDLRSAPCQVGPLGDAMRKDHQFWRSIDPVFSICGNHQPIETPSSKQRFAFDDHSGLGQLYARDGSVLFYGASLSSATLLHFAETRSGGPVYRYEKSFIGCLTDPQGNTEELEYIYHVRPMGMALAYDWPRIQRDLDSAGLISRQTIGNETVALMIPAVELVDFWVEKLETEPLYFLDRETREKVNSLGLPKGVRVHQLDFE